MCVASRDYWEFEPSAAESLPNKTKNLQETILEVTAYNGHKYNYYSCASLWVYVRMRIHKCKVIIGMTSFNFSKKCISCSNQFVVQNSLDVFLVFANVAELWW